MKQVLLIVVLLLPVSLCAQEPRDEGALADQVKAAISEEVSKLPVEKILRGRVSDSLKSIADSLMAKSVRTRQDTIQYMDLRREYLEWNAKAQATAQLDSVGIKIKKIWVGREHPEWVHLDFPYSTATGRRYQMICQAIRDLISMGAEPSYVDSVIAEGHYVRRLVPGKVRANAGVALAYMNRIRENGISPVATYADTTNNLYAKWRRFLKVCITDGRY